MFTTRFARPSDAAAVSQLIFDSTNAWYESHGFGKIFQCAPEDCRLFFDVYEDLDPGFCLVAEEESSGKLIGSCFFHPRDTHVSLGIMNADATFAGKGIARALLSHIVQFARERFQPLRLFSSAMNLDSYSLYTKQGFAPYAVFQDMLITVPESGVECPGISTNSVRSATLDDVPAIVNFEEEIWHVRRPGDWEYFIKNERNLWSVLIYDTEDGIRGVLGSVNHAASKLLGPGVADSADVAASLVVAQLNQFRGETYVFLVPTDNTDLVAMMYRLGARNCELHFGQSLGPAPEIQGVVMPTFMPETG